MLTPPITHARYDTMTKDERTAFIAAHVMGWTPLEDDTTTPWSWRDTFGEEHEFFGDGGGDEGVPRYTEDIAAASEVVEALYDRGYDIAIQRSHNAKGVAVLVYETGAPVSFTLRDYATEAICIAALRTLNLLDPKE